MSILSPSMSVEAKNIGNMQPAQALQYLTQKGLPLSLAISVLENAQVQKAAKTQQAIQQMMGPQPPVVQQVHQQAQQLGMPPVAPTTGGVADLPVNADMYSFGKKGMAEGGIVAFSGGGDEGEDLTPDAAQASQALAADPNSAWLTSIEQKWAASTKNPQRSYGSNTYPNVNAITQWLDEGGDAPNTERGNMYMQASGPYRQLARQRNANIDTVVGQTLRLRDQEGQQARLRQAGIPSLLPQQETIPSAAMQGTTPSPDAPATAAPATGNPAAASPFGLRSLRETVDLGNSNFYTTGRMNDLSRRGDTLLAQQQTLQGQAETELQGMAPGTFDQMFDRVHNNNLKLGIGNALKDYKENVLPQREAQMQEMYKQGKWMALSQAGFAMAEAATRNPHGGFLGALAVGGAQGGRDFLQAAKDYRESNQKLADARFSVAQAEENLKKGESQEARQMYDNAVARYDRMYSSVTDTRMRVLGTQFTATENEMARLGAAHEAQQGRISAALVAREGRVAYNPQVLAYQDLRRQGLDPLASLRRIQEINPTVLRASQEDVEKFRKDSSRLIQQYNDPNIDPTRKAQIRATLIQSGSLVGITPEQMGFAQNVWTMDPKTGQLVMTGK